MSSSAEHPDGARGRFDRALERDRREQTALLDWLAQSQKAEALRQTASDDSEAPGVVIDLRHDVVIDLRPSPDPRPRRRRDLEGDLDDASASSTW